MNPIHEYGKYGGRVLRPFKGEVPWIADAEISAEQAMKWPLANRKALYEDNKIEWYGPPEDTEKRVAAAEKTKAPEKDKTKAPAVKKSSRTK